MAKGYVMKTVVFNPADPDQKKLIEHADKRPNFSAYIKRLIQRDMDGVGSVMLKEIEQTIPGEIDAEQFI